MSPKTHGNLSVLEEDEDVTRSAVGIWQTMPLSQKLIPIPFQETDMIVMWVSICVNKQKMNKYL